MEAGGTGGEVGMLLREVGVPLGEAESAGRGGGGCWWWVVGRCMV